MSLTWVLLAGAAGALLGPVLRTRIFRYAVPAERRVRDSCPACGRRLVAGGRFGLATALPPTGRCPGCRQRIGPGAGTVEAVAGAAFAALALVGRSLPELAAFCWLAALGVALGFIDVAVHRLPDRLTLSAYAGVFVLLGVAAVGDDRLGTLGRAVAYGLGMACCYLLLAVIHPAGMGLGDVKLALGLGLALGWLSGTATVLGTAAGFLFAGVFAAVLLAAGRAGRKDAIPHGPFMLLGAFVVILLTG